MLVSADDVIPAAILQALKTLQAGQQTIITNQETIMTNQANEQQMLNDLGTAVQASADHVSAASGLLQTWIENNQATEGPLDFTGAQTALASLQAADSTLQGIVPQTPAQPITPVPDPGPAPDPTPDPGPDSPPPDAPPAPDPSQDPTPS